MQAGTTMQSPLPPFDTVADAVEAIANGEFVIVVDDTDRENEGDLIIAAEKITTEQMAFLVKYSSGLVCVAMQEQRLQALDLPQMVAHNADPFRTAFTVSVDYQYGTTSGISAADRALTLRALADPSSQASDFHRPGHIFPLRARLGGVLERPGHTEAAHDLAAMAGLQPVGVLCEIVNDDGSMARRPDLLRFAKQHGLKMITIADMIVYRERQLQVAYPRQPVRPVRQQSTLLDAAMVYSG
jgi:3,4-dihydroxy-2-butanone 4-phosphate synthase